MTITARRAAESEGLIVLSALLIGYLQRCHRISEIDGPHDWPEINMKGGNVAHRGLARLFGWDHGTSDEEIAKAKGRLNVERSMGRVQARVTNTFWDLEDAGVNGENGDEGIAALRRAGSQWTIEVATGLAETGAGGESEQWEAKDHQTARRVAERAAAEMGVNQGRQEPEGRWLRLTRTRR